MIVKICGVTRPEDVAACADYGVDWIGLNLWPESPRHIDLERASALAARAREQGLVPVGLLVRPDADEVRRVWRRGAFDMLQLYDPTEDVPADVVWIRPVAVAPEGPIERPPGSARFDLIETKVAGYGGRGKRFAWDRLAGAGEGVPYLVAGGIGPDNVAELLAGPGAPLGIDVASGVESAPGVKDPDKIRKLLAEVRRHTDASHSD